MALIEAMRKGRVNRALELVAEGPLCLFERDSFQTTPLQMAAKLGLEEVVIRLLEAGVDPDERDIFGATALHRAAGWGNCDVIERLLEAGASPILRSTGGAEPLHDLAKGKQGSTRRDAVRLLVTYGGRVNSQENAGRSPLFFAVCRNNECVVDALLLLGADPVLKARGQQGSPLDQARQMKAELLVRRLEVGLRALESGEVERGPLDPGEADVGLGVDAEKDTRVEQVLLPF